jgi:hypothetical protein
MRQNTPCTTKINLHLNKAFMPAEKPSRKSGIAATGYAQLVPAWQGIKSVVS